MDNSFGYPFEDRFPRDPNASNPNDAADPKARPGETYQEYLARRGVPESLRTERHNEANTWNHDGVSPTAGSIERDAQSAHIAMAHKREAQIAELARQRVEAFAAWWESDSARKVVARILYEMGE